MRVWALIAFLLLALAGAARAVEPGERLADPELEARARAISKELRCLVCPNESIDESNAELAHDLRLLLRQRLASGDSDRQVLDFLVSRYGRFVLLRPPVEPATYLLWFGPPLVLALGGLGVALHLRRRRAAPDAVPAPLSEAERRRLARLLKDPSTRGFGGEPGGPPTGRPQGSDRDAIGRVRQDGG